MDSGNAEEENVCYICLGPIRFMGTTDCNHAYCRDCIMKALSYDHRENRDLKCPYCRQTVSKVYSCLEREFEAVVFRENREIKLEELSATNENLTEKLARAAEKNVELAEENARLREKNVKLTQKLEVERRKKPVVRQQRDEMYLDREHVVNVLAAIEKDLQSISVSQGSLIVVYFIMLLGCGLFLLYLYKHVELFETRLSILKVSSDSDM